MEMIIFPDDPVLSAAVRDWWDQNCQLGKALGYPDCCVQAFCNQPPELMRGGATADDRMRYEAACTGGSFTGFVPCITHAGMIMRGQIALSDLIVNRDPSFPAFPNHK